MRFLLLLSALSLLVSVYASQFVACLNTAGVSAGLLGLGSLVNQVGNLITVTEANCESNCVSGGYTYSYFMPGPLLGLASKCYCANVGPTASYLDTGSNAVGACATSSYQVQNLNAVENFKSCYASITSLQIGLTKTYTDPTSCFTSCKSYPAMQLVSSTTGVWTCTCSNSYSIGAAQTCGEGVPQLYTQSVPTISGLSRRDMLKRSTFDAERSTFCPKGMTACGVKGSLESFECLDVQSELAPWLESCGGCMTSALGTSNNTTGVDCTALPGVSMGGVTCTAGQCQVYRCKDGWQLVNGRCESYSEMVLNDGGHITVGIGRQANRPGKQTTMVSRHKASGRRRGAH